MPSFHPMNAYGPYQLPPPTEHGLGYLPTKYGPAQDRSAFSNCQYHGPDDLGPLHPDPFDHYKNPAAQPVVYNQLNGYSSSSANIAPPAFPPLRMDSHRFATEHVNQHYEQRALREINNNPRPTKEEKTAKPTGGVAGSNLDYDMEQMIDFVCEMTVGMYDLYISRLYLEDIDFVRSLKLGKQYPNQFRKWVSQVLNATRLPAATILLSLSYFGLRVRQLSTSGQYQPQQRTYYQMLAIALILGSKFLDDNTFQNKSWAEVTYIPTSELNQDERNWLIDFGHRLHFDPAATSGYESFREQWDKFRSRTGLLPPALHLNTELRGGRPARQQLSPLSLHTGYPKSAVSSFSVDSNYSDRQFSASAYSPYDGWYPRGSARDRSPSTAPHTGPTTPEYYAGPSVWGPTDTYLSRQPPYQYGQVSQFTPPQMSSYQPSYQRSIGYQPPIQSAWNCHGVTCQCNGCRNPYTLQPSYGPIIVG